MTRLKVYATLLALIVVGIWAIGKASDIASERRTRTEMLEENAVTVALVFKHRRDSVMAATDAQADVVADVSRTTDRAAERLTLTLAADNIFDVEARRHSSLLKDYAPLAGRDVRLTAHFAY